MINMNLTRFFEHMSTFDFYEVQRNITPLQQIHSDFYQFMIELCRQERHYIIIAGSSALEQEMRRVHQSSVVPNDVDFFTSLYIEEEEMATLVEMFKRLIDTYDIEASKNPVPKNVQYREMSKIRDVWNFTVRPKLPGNLLGDPISLPNQGTFVSVLANADVLTIAINV